MSTRNFYSIFLSLFIPLIISATPLASYHIQPINKQELLPSKQITHIYQDSEGYMWFCTTNGLCRYDGYTNKVYKSTYTSPTLLNNNWVNTLIEDKNNKLWIGTVNGINILDKKTGKMETVDRNKLAGKHVWTFLYTRDNILWIGTSNGLYRYDEKADSFYVYQNKILKTNSIYGDDIRVLYEDSDGFIWIGTWGNGLCRLNPRTEEFINCPYLGDEGRIGAIYEDKDKNLWLGTVNHLFKIENHTNPLKILYTRYDKDIKYERLIHSITQDKNGNLLVGTSLGLDIITYPLIPDNYRSSFQDSTRTVTNYEINDLYKGKNGMIWMATQNSGIYLMYEKEQPFSNHPFYSIDDFKQPLSVTAIYKWNKDEFLLGVEKVGLVKYNIRTNRLTSRANDPDLKKFPDRIGNIQIIFKHPLRDELLMGSEYGGLLSCTLQNNKITSVKQHFPFWGGWIAGDIIKDICCDEAQNIWIGSNYGINILTAEQDTLSYVNLNQGEMIEVQSICHDYKNQMWLGTKNNGIFLADASQGVKGLTFRNYNQENGTINSNEIKCIYQDNKHRLWAGTKGGGLSMLNRETDKFELIDCMQEIPGDAIFSIAESNGLLYIGTNQGLVQYNPEGEKGAQIKIFTTEDGLLDNAFNQGTVLSDLDNQLHFGMANGFCSFYPKDIKETSSKVKTVISDLKIFHNSFDNLPMSKQRNLSPQLHPSYSKSITLSNNDYNFGIEFASLTFKNPEKNRYAYMLEGFDKEWHYVDANHRYAYYTNLRSGTYRFLVKGTNENSFMGEQPEILHIKVLPPLYATWWAYCLYFLIICLILWITFRIFRYKLEIKEALKLEQIEHAKSEELAQEKLKFFTNISHELLTPLSLITCSVEELRLKYNSKDSVFNVMKTNIQRLNRLLEQILEFRKAENGGLKLTVSFGDIGSFITKICNDNFLILGKSKNIELIIENPKPHIPGWFDKDKVDKIIYNLLSNAFKYNKINGKVKITLSPEGAVSDFEYKRLTVTVGNTGIGISEKHIHSIFQRFYEINYKDSEKRGNGIGLSLTKNLVELHNGTIQVTSIPNEWTEFSFSIPLEKTAYREEQIEDNSGIHSPEILPDIATTECAETTLPEKSEESQTDKKHTILVIEDNEELLQSIRNLLATQFIVYTTTNGSEGIDIAQSKNPELILSDIMMPGMNGFEVCRTIKQEISTSHIPVVLLSAKISDEDKLEGFQVSADAYITKPFNFQLLKAQLLSIIENRELTAQKFKSTPLTQSIQVSLTSMDEKILNRAIEAVEKNIENPEFDLQAFTEEMNISNSMLYRKLKSLTNLSPNEFIRNIRLKASCKLLLEQKGNISEIAYRVGFNDAKYFSRCFKKEFDMTPMEYIEQNKTTES